jgi:hypothetical protein
MLAPAAQDAGSGGSGCWLRRIRMLAPAAQDARSGGSGCSRRRLGMLPPAAQDAGSGGSGCSPRQRRMLAPAAQDAGSGRSGSRQWFKSDALAHGGEGPLFSGKKDHLISDETKVPPLSTARAASARLRAGRTFVFAKKSSPHFRRNKRPPPPARTDPCFRGKTSHCGGVIFRATRAHAWYRDACKSTGPGPTWDFATI